MVSKTRQALARALIYFGGTWSFEVASPLAKDVDILGTITTHRVRIPFECICLLHIDLMIFRLCTQVLWTGCRSGFGRFFVGVGDLCIADR